MGSGGGRTEEEDRLEHHAGVVVDQRPVRLRVPPLHSTYKTVNVHI